jgi:hypothetical protein
MLLLQFQAFQLLQLGVVGGLVTSYSRQSSDTNAASSQA